MLQATPATKQARIKSGPMMMMHHNFIGCRGDILCLPNLYINIVALAR